LARWEEEEEEEEEEEVVGGGEGGGGGLIHGRDTEQIAERSREIDGRVGAGGRQSAIAPLSNEDMAPERKVCERNQHASIMAQSCMQS
jgi:hypothetical protein